MGLDRLSERAGGVDPEPDAGLVVKLLALAGILDQVDESVVIQLTDPDGAAVDEDVVARAIEDADATINVYCQELYLIPLSPVPDKMRQVGVDIAIYKLYSRRGDTMPETRRDNYRDAIKFLEKVSEGKIKLKCQAAKEAEGGEYSGGVIVSSRDKEFGPTTMDKY